jgi:hypothetical protein
MCTFAFGNNKQRYACFNCRKVFKFPSDFRYHLQDNLRKCLECGNGLYAMGLFFRVPPKADKKQWKKVEILALNGYRYHHLRCCSRPEPGYRPRNLRDVPEFLGVQNSKKARKQFFRQYSH